MSGKIKIYGHRGASGTYPENTLPAFYAAVAAGVDGMELDVQMTKDGELVVIHDERIDRTTNGIGFVKDHLYKQLKLFDAGSWFHPSHAGVYIPSLVEVLEWVNSLEKKIAINIELKNDLIDYPNIEEKVLGLLYQYNLKSQTILSSFNRGSVARIHDLDSSVETAFLLSGVPVDALQVAKTIHAKAIHCEASFAKSVIGERAVRLGLPLRVYTINSIEAYKDLEGFPISVIMTDYPDLFI